MRHQTVSSSPERSRPLWTSETVERFPDRTCGGGEEIAAYFEDVLRASHMRVLAIAEQGEVCVRPLAPHRHSPRAASGLEPTGEPVSIDGMTASSCAMGLVVLNFVIFDQMPYAGQLGMLPPPESAGASGVAAPWASRTARGSRR